MLPILTDITNLIETKLVVNRKRNDIYDFQNPEDIEVVLSSDLMEVLLKHQLKDCKLSEADLGSMIANTESYISKLRNLYKFAYHHIVIQCRATKLQALKLPKGFSYDKRPIANLDRSYDTLITILIKVRSKNITRKKAIKKLKKVKHVRID